MRIVALILAALLPIGASAQVEWFPLKDVRLLDSPFKENQERSGAWLKSIDVNRLLHSFRTTAGVWAGNEGGYMTVKKLGGWESLDCELRGHTTGHVLSACALQYASTGDPAYKAKGDSLVLGLREVQLAHGNGYLSAFPEELINRNIRGERVWAPWYTLHKILAGLIDQYELAGSELALTEALDMAHWAQAKLSGLSEESRRLMLRNEFGGIPEAWWNLYGITRDEACRWLAEFFYHDDVIDPLKAQKADFGTKHTNTFLPKVIAEARRYELTGSEDFARIKLGVGAKPNKNMDLADWVLSKFRPEERKEMELSAANAYECLKLMVNDKTDEAMNKYNA
jgi:DUF1680 family protein